MFSDPGIQKQLNLNNDQLTQLNNSFGTSFGTFNKGLGSMSQLNLSDQQRAQQTQGLTNTFNSQFGTAAQGILNPEQFQRFNQLQLQSRGAAAFSDPQLSQKLNLTQAQQQQLQNIASQEWQQLNQIYNMAGTDPTKATSQYDTFRKQQAQTINSILTPEQRQTWQQMVGQPYDFPPSWTWKK